MKKNINKIIIMIIAVMLVSVFAFGCGNDNPKGKLYIIEAESMDLSNFYGQAESANPNGAGTILGVNTNAPKVCTDSLNKKKADGSEYNNGYFVGFFNGAQNSFSFTFESDANAKATFSLRLGSEFGNLKFDTNNLTIKVNGKEISFKEFTISGPSNRTWGEFKDYSINVEIDLRKNDLTGENNDVIVNGEVKVAKPIRVQNTIEIILGNNSYWTGFSAGGFGIDCLKLTTEANITWQDFWVGGWAIDWDLDENAPINQVGNKNQLGGGY